MPTDSQNVSLTAMRPATRALVVAAFAIVLAAATTLGLGIDPVAASTFADQPAPSPAPSPTEDAADRAPIVVFLVRHAEKAEGGRDPELTDAGRARAVALASLVRDAGITHVHTTDYRRTRETAAPSAESLGLRAEVYDPRRLAAFAERLRRTPGRHLVVGHSNTTPALCTLLGGDGAPPIVEATEYDRLEVLTIHHDGTTTAIRLRLASGI